MRKRNDRVRVAADSRARSQWRPIRRSALVVGVLVTAMTGAAAQAQAATLTVTPACVNNPATTQFILSGSDATPNSFFDVDIISNINPGYHTTVAEGNTDSAGAFGPIGDFTGEFTPGTYIANQYPVNGSKYTLRLLVSIAGILIDEGLTTIRLGHCRHRG